MVRELDLLTVWIPEQMSPGKVFPLEDQSTGEESDPYWAVLSCPECATLGLITQKQASGCIPVICGSDECSAHFIIVDDKIVPRKPM